MGALADRVQSGLRARLARARHAPRLELRTRLAASLEAREVSPSIEYYGEVESINVPPRAQPEVHQVFLGGDWEVSPGFSVNLGTGFDVGPNGPGVVLKSRFEWHWGKHTP
jgi:hypothetical protein